MSALLDRVRGFVARLSPDPVCDNCITERLDLVALQRVNQETRRLAGSDGFERRRDICSLCSAEKTVTSRRA